ncbi:OmpW family outer membrane protein [Flavitalea sp. BT771]|uniref:outer membrane beta-barrel protein n=1 Tax=Flavitalea sp. BT771 TaxID=3063329 RepID=UPI0026E25B22|nr:OmpW family outer membrane protein [Flavitalea sp. BT771]MDO6435499.1 OmpW family outer membrane protein [Flavitalea sp. BT771]MDV6224399.1 OmpW family outer membrane protein [Flavitalea sp. BT771]
MRTILKFAGTAAIILLISCPALHAQDQLQVTAGYNVNIPAGSFRDYVTHPAYKGFNAGLAYPINPQLSVGLSFGYNDYYQKYPRQTYDDGKGNTVSAVVSNSVQQIPVLLTANYTLVKKGFIRPYVGAGAGVNFVTFDQYLGEFDDPHSTAKWALKGEAGFYIPLSTYSSTAIKIGGSYNYMPYNRDGVKNLDTWGIEAGIRFPIH